MHRALTDIRRENIQHNLSDDEKEHPKRDITQRPAVFKGADNEKELARDVDGDEDSVDDVQQYEQRGGFCRGQAGVGIESADGDGESDEAHDRRADAQEPDGEGGAVFVHLEADEAVDEEAGAGGRRQSRLNGDEPGVGRAADWNYPGVET